MSQFKFSIITVVKNDQENILKTLKSVLNQKKQVDLEYIIIDGNSSDSTLNVVKQYKNEVDKIVSENENGLLHVKNVFVRDKCDFVFGTVLRNYIGEKIIKQGFDKKRIYFNFDFATAHSCGFYVKKKIIEEIGKYNVKYKCSSDYDFYYRLINSNKFHGSYTTKDEIVGEIASGGFSSTLSFFEHLIEETKIRIDNKQSKVIISIIFVNALIKNLFKKFLRI